MRLSSLEIPSERDGRRRAGRPGLRGDRRTPLSRRLAIVVAVAATVVVGALSTGVAPSHAAAPAPAPAPAPASLTAATASQATAPSASQFQFSAEPYAAPGAQQRSQFIYQLQAGHTIRDQVVIKNLSSIDETFLVYGEDATNVPKTGGYAYEQRSQMHNTEVGKWLTIGAKNVPVAAGQQVVDTFALSIPSNAPPGDHVGAVVVEQVKGPVSQQPSGVNLVLRIAVPMFVRVVGKTYPGLTIENLKVFHESPAVPYVGNAPKVAVRFDVVNTGNVILNPQSVTTSITGRLSGTVHTFTTHHQASKSQGRDNPLPAQMLPGGKLTLTERWTGIPPVDPLTASVTARAVDPSTNRHVSTTASTKFWYFPWIVLLILLALILLVIAYFWNRRRRRAKAAAAAAGGGGGPEGGEPEGGDTPPPPPVPESGTLEEAPR